MSSEQEQAMAYVRKNVWSRERIEELRAIAHMQVDADDGQLIMDAAFLLLTTRQALRGGRLEVRGSRHWEDR